MLELLGKKDQVNRAAHTDEASHNKSDN